MSHKKLNLYRQYRKLTKPKLDFRSLRSHAAPVFFLTVLLLGAWALLLRQDLALMDETDRLQAQLDAPEAVEKVNESREWDERGRALQGDLEAVERLTGRLAGYPQVDSLLLDQIAKAGAEGISVAITGYDSATGELQFNAISREVIDIPGYVKALEETGLFQTVSYTGYSFEDDGYVLRLNCALCPGTGREG